MKKLNNKGFAHVLVLAVLVIGIGSIAYAAFAQVLNVSGTGTATGEFNVQITDITRTSGTGAGASDAIPATFNGTSATFNTDLQYPGATATYAVTVTNSGSIPAVLSSLTDLAAKNAEAPTYITYLTSGVTAGSTTLAANGGTNVLEVTVTWDAASSPDITTGNSKSATITLNYDQDS